MDKRKEQLKRFFIPEEKSRNKRFYSKEFAKKMGSPIDLHDYLKFLSYLKR